MVLHYTYNSMQKKILRLTKAIYNFRHLNTIWVFQHVHKKVPKLILTQSFEELSRGKFSIEEDGVVVAVKGATHAYE